MNWQRVEQVVEPVICPVVDVRVPTKVGLLTQRRRVRIIVGVEVVRIVQRHQNDQTLLAFAYDVVMKCNFEFVHAG